MPNIVDLGSFMPNRWMKYEQKLALGQLLTQKKTQIFFAANTQLAVECTNADNQKVRFTFSLKANVLRKKCGTDPSTDDFYVITDNSFGRGGFGQVFAVLETLRIQSEDGSVEYKENKDLIVKVIPNQDKNTYYEVLDEIRFSRSVKYLHMKEYVYVHDINAYCLIMQYKSGLNIREQVKKQILSLSQGIHWSLELLYILKYLIHIRHIIHRDLTPRNVILDLQAELLAIIDFGLAITIDDGRFLGESAGTKTYKPYEQFKGTRITLRSDLYTATLTILALLNLQYSNQGRGRTRASNNILITDESKAVLSELPVILRDELIQKIEKKLRVAENERGDIDELITILEKCDLHFRAQSSASDCPIEHFSSAYHLGLALRREIMHARTNDTNSFLVECMLIINKLQLVDRHSAAVNEFCYASGVRLIRNLTKKEDIEKHLTNLQDLYFKNFNKHTELEECLRVLSGIRDFTNANPNLFTREYCIELVKLSRRIREFIAKKHNPIANLEEFEYVYGKIQMRLLAFIEEARALSETCNKVRMRQEHICSGQILLRLETMRLKINDFLNALVLTEFDAAWATALYQLYHSVSSLLLRTHTARTQTLSELREHNRTAKELTGALEVRFDNIQITATYFIDQQLYYYRVKALEISGASDVFCKEDVNAILEELYKFQHERTNHIDTPETLFNYHQLTVNVSRETHHLTSLHDRYLMKSIAKKKRERLGDIQSLLECKRDNQIHSPIEILRNVIKMEIRVFMIAVSHGKTLLFFDKTTLPSQVLRQLRSMIDILTKAQDIDELRNNLRWYFNTIQDKSRQLNILSAKVLSTLDNYENHAHRFGLM